MQMALTSQGQLSSFVGTANGSFAGSEADLEWYWHSFAGLGEGQV